MIHNCERCPLRPDCYAFDNDKVKVLPIRARKTKQRNRYFNYFIYLYKGNTYISKRTKNDIWKNLYEFPMIETSRRYSEERLQKENSNYFSHTSSLRKTQEVKHILSHQVIYGKFYFLELKKEPLFLSSTKTVKWDKLEDYPFSQMIIKRLDMYQKEQDNY